MQPTIMKANEPQDLLALVPQLSGFLPVRSVVLVAFRGRRTCGALRFNLPAPDTPADVHKRISTTMVGMLCKLQGVDSVVPVIYTDDSFRESQGIPHRRFAERLVSRLRQSGFGIRDSLCVADDGWGSFLDPDCPVAGRPLSDILNSELYEAPSPGSSGSALGTLVSGADLPVVSRGAKERFGRMYRRYTRAISSPDTAMALIDTFTDLLDPVELAERALDWNPEEMLDEESAALLLMLQSPATRDQMMVQFAFGREEGVRVFALNSHYAALQRATGRSMDDIVWGEMTVARAAAAAGDRGTDAEAAMNGKVAHSDATMIGMLHNFGSDLLMGMSQVRPDPDRIERGITLLKRVVALAPRAARPAPLCMLAWLSWALGLGTVGGLFVDKALAIDAEYGMAAVLHTLISTGHLPEWSFAEPE